MAEPEGPLHSSSQTVATISDAAYWRKVCPGLRIGSSKFQARVRGRLDKAEACVASRADCAVVRSRLLEEGYASLPPASLEWSVPVARLAEAVLQLEQHGWPPTFLAVYDEAWAMALDASQIMRHATGNSLCMDVVGFLVDPSRTKGFSPHRDRQPEDWMRNGMPEDVASTFKPDGMAKYVTLWAALTDAHPDNSCLHFVPKACDPGYVRGDPEDGDPLQRCFPNNEGYQNIRCAAVGAGGCTFHTHRTIHWGNRGRPSYEGPPRIAISFGFSTADFEAPYFKESFLPFPPLDLRLSLCSAQVLNYATLATGDAEGWVALAGSMAGFTKGALRRLHDLFTKNSKVFTPAYHSMILEKYAKVSTGLAPEPSTPCVAGAGAEVSGDSDDDVLAAMLNSEKMSGEVLFHDDFDMLEGSVATADEMAFPGKRPKGAKRRRQVLADSEGMPARRGPAALPTQAGGSGARRKKRR